MPEPSGRVTAFVGQLGEQLVEGLHGPQAYGATRAGVLQRPGARSRRATAVATAATAASYALVLRASRAGRPGRSACSLVVAGEHPEADRHAGVARDPGQPVGGRLADVLEVRRAAADDHPEGDHGVVARSASRRATTRQLERSRHPHHRRRRDAGTRPARAGRRRAARPSPRGASRRRPRRPAGRRRPRRAAAGCPRRSSRRPLRRHVGQPQQVVTHPVALGRAGSARFSGVVATGSGTGRTPRDRSARMADHLAGLLVSSRTECTPRSARICAPSP